MENPGSSEEDRRSWQIEADLLADGRELLERLSASTRYRYLYPDGPSVGLLLAAYQEFDRLRTVGRIRGGRWRRWRAFRRILRRTIQADVADRSHRLDYRYPAPRPGRLPPVPPLVSRAMAAVDPDARDLVLTRLGVSTGRQAPVAAQTGAAPVGAASRGDAQFKQALINEALANPRAIPSLHLQYLWALTSALPTKRRHPIATLLLVKLPLQFLVLVFTLLNVAYITAYYTFNDDVLGDFISTRVSGLLEGDLVLGSVHWEGRLIFDLLTGTPSPVVVENVEVWEPYKSTAHGRSRRAAHADRIEATLVLHEIIPWNRLGIPTLFDIPWVLHFEEVQIDEPMWYAVREYDDTLENGETVRYRGLTDAFLLYEPPVNDNRGLSFDVDAANIGPTVVEVDSMETSGWRASARLTQGEFSLAFEAPDPAFEEPMELPFSFSVSGSGPEGLIEIDDIEVPLGDFRIDRFASNGIDIAAGDLVYAIEADASGSPISVRGTLRDMFPRLHDPQPPAPTRVSLYAVTQDARGITEQILRELDLPPTTVVAKRAEASASIRGLLDDPVYQLAASGLTMDLVGEPAWAADDVRLSLSMATEPIPEIWKDDYGVGEVRQVVTFDALRGSALDGAFELEPRDFEGDEATPEALDPTSATAHIVMPLFEEEPYRISAPLRLAGANPAQLTPDDPEVSDRLRGVASGGVDVRRLVLGPVPTENEDDDEGETETGLLLAELDIDDMVVRRDRGPESDGLPRDINVDGRVVFDQEGALDVDGLVITTPGARVRGDGGFDPGTQKLDELLLDLKIDDGRAFARSFGIPPYFDQLRARMKLDGPLLAPGGSGGGLTVKGVSETTAPSEAKIWMEGGVLFLRSDDIRILGGRGSIDAQVAVFENGGVSSNPKLRANVKLDGVDLAMLVGDPISGRAKIDVEIGDAEGRPARISDLEVHGTAESKAFTLAGTTYPNAATTFRLSEDEVIIEELRLPIHRPVSPHFANSVTLMVGEILAKGTVTFDRDPGLDLFVEARGVPLTIVAKLLDVDPTLRGQIGSGTELTVGGTLRRPRVEGHLALVGLSAAGIGLGTGELEVTSEDYAAEGPLAAHREVRVEGELRTGRRRRPVQWAIDAVFAIGETPERGESPPLAAQLDVDFDHVSLETLLRNPVDPQLSPPVEGELEEITAHVLTCNEGRAMLSDCIGTDGSTPLEQTLSVELAMESGWVRSSLVPLAEGTAPCDSETTLCSQTPLEARVEWPKVALMRPFDVAAGGKGGARVSVSGEFDLSSPPQTSTDTPRAVECRPPGLSSGQLGTMATGAAGGAGQAHIEGAIDLETLLPLLASYGLQDATGRIDVNANVDGYLFDPRVAGTARLGLTTKASGATASGLTIDYEPLPFPIEVGDLDVRLAQGWLSAAGDVRISGSTIHVGSADGMHTGFALSGACAGYFGAAAEGKLSAAVLAKLVGSPLASGPGGVDLEHFGLQGHVGETVELDAFAGRAKFSGTSSLALEFDEGVTSAKIDRGTVDFRRCGPTDCPRAEEGWYVIDIGGLTGSTSATQPAEALRATSGTRGRAFAWGRTFLAPDFEHATGSELQVRLDDVPYRSFDVTGRPVYEAELTSEELTIRGGTPLVVGGNIELDRARYVKDAVQGVEILALTDSGPAQVDTPPPTILQGMTFDIRLETDRPLRVENNVASGVLASAVVDVTGTYEDPEFTGRFEVEPGGTVDIPFLTGTYEIQRGRVTLLRELEDAEVDILALRNEPIYIDDQPRTVQLLLGGTLSAIRWSCIADGDSGGALDTVRGCTEYLVLGAGDVQVTENDVQQFGAGGLAGVRKPLSVVGHLTEFDVGERVADAAPRIRTYVPDVRLRLGQIGPELEIATPTEWFDFDYGRATFGWDYTRGYPGFLLRQSRELKARIEILDPVTIEYSRRTRSYLNERIVFDPLEQRSLELQFDFEIPSLR